MAQSVDELKQRAEAVELVSHSTSEERCDTCTFYSAMKEAIGYCTHPEVDMVVGGPWWCKLWTPRQSAAKQG